MPLGSVLLVLAIYVLVAARLTRLVNYDVVLDSLRLFVDRRAATALTAAQDTEGSAIDYPTYVKRYNRWTVVGDFLVCPWCVGFWVCVLLAPAAVMVLCWSWWTVAVLPFAASHLVGIGDRWVRENDDDA